MERYIQFDRLKRRFLILSLPILSVAGFVQSPLYGRDGGSSLATMLIWLIPAGLALLLWRKRRSLRFVETATLLWVIALWLTFFYQVLFGSPETKLEQLTLSSPWLAVTLGAPFLLFGPRKAMWVASGTYLASLGFGLVYLLSPSASTAEPVVIKALIQIYLASAILISILYFQSLIREQFERARTLARSMSDLAHTDPLLGIPNRRQMQTLIQHEIRLAADGLKPASLIMLDLDRFKEINDTFGHETGDQVLKAVIAAVKQTLRSSDRVGRWGGDEFVILVGTCDLDQANLLAERIADAVYQRLNDRFIRVTISQGVAACHPDDTVESWVGRADRALYRAKQSGRNRVVIGS